MPTASATLEALSQRHMVSHCAFHQEVHKAAKGQLIVFIMVYSNAKICIFYQFTISQDCFSIYFRQFSIF